MKVSSIAITGLAGLATASELDKRYITTVEVECHEKTVTVAAGAAAAPSQAANPPLHSNGEHQSTQYTNGAQVTSVDYNWQSTQTYLPSAGLYPNPYDPQETISAEAAKWTDVMVPWTTAYVWPTGGAAEQEAIKAVYQHTIIVEVVNVYMNVEQHTVISTQSSVQPSSTPAAPPPPAFTQVPPPEATQNPPPTMGKTIPVELVAEQVEGRTLFKYKPDRVNAAVGDIVLFKFKARAHSATQSSFDNPCTRATDAQGRPLFDSELIPNADNLEGAAFERAFVVYDTAPKWFYCKQPNSNHCGSGMVFGINPGDRMDQFIAKAIEVNGALVTRPVSSAAASTGAAASSVVSSAASSIVTDAASSVVTDAASSVVASSVATDAATVITEAVSSAATDVASTVVTDAASATAPAPGAVTSTVIVEGGIQPDGSGSTLVFSPPLLNNMKRGDTIKFDFRRANHTLTESTLAEPCKRREGGIDTEFANANPDGTPGLKTFDLVLDGEGPRYFYCKQANGRPNGHCKAGMVFAVNVESARFDTFVANARAAPLAQKRAFEA